MPNGSSKAARWGRSSTKFDHSVTLVSYGYNEEEALPDFFERATALLESVVDDYEIVFIDDGSNDQTAEIAEAHALKDPRIRVYHNESNRNIGYSFKRGVSLAHKEYLFWQTIDWSYDLSELRIFLELLNHNDVVLGARSVPTRLLPKIRIFRWFYGITSRSDDLWRAVISLTNYYILKMLFGLAVSDFQNIQFHATKTLQSFDLRGESSFLGIEMMVRACERNLTLIEVPIQFLPRIKGMAKGVQVAAVLKSVRDIFRNWLAWGWRFRFSRAAKTAKIARLTEPASLSDEDKAIAADIIARYSPASKIRNEN